MQGNSRALSSLHARTLKAARAALDLLFPISCIGCGRYEERQTLTDGERWMCSSCCSLYPNDYGACIICKTRSASGRTCPACSTRTALTGVLAVGSYRDPVLQGAVKRLKFRGVRAVAEPLGALLARRIVAAGISDAALIPIPLHPRRSRERGYNQARVLADVVAQHLRFPVQDMLTRRRASAPQTSIFGHGKARAENVTNVFSLTPETSLPPHGRILLIDDVLTTGSTLSAAAAALRPLQPTEVWGAVIARG